MTSTVEGADKAAYKKEWYRRNADRERAKQRVRYAATKPVHPYKKDPGLRRDNKLNRLYGINGRGHWEAIFDAQGRKCACCKGTDPGHSYGYHAGWHVDHDHNNPEPNYRAILCAYCNIAIGNARGCSSRLRACADYVDKHTLAKLTTCNEATTETPIRGETDGEE